ncbi:MAG: universal stress protein [Thermoanaerobaculia bacterium]
MKKARSAPSPVLIAVDLSIHGPSVLKEGFREAKSRKAPALVLHVIDDRFPYPDLYSLGHPDSNFYKTLRKDALGQLKQWINAAGDRDAPEFLIVWGKPSATILEVARERNPQLLVIGAHGLTEPRHAHTIGGTVERVSRETPCSILIVFSATGILREAHIVPSGLVLKETTATTGKTPILTRGNEPP